MTPQLITAIVLFILAGGLMIWANTMLGNARKIAKEANDKCESAKEEIEELWDRNKRLSGHVKFLQKQVIFGNDKPFRYGLVEADSFFEVFAVYHSVDGNTGCCIPVKKFDFGDDREFARLEAQELLDHLIEK